MRATFTIILTAIVFLSCKHSNKELKERLAVTDSIAINYFKGDGSMDTVVAVRIIRDKNTVEQLSNFVAADIIKEKANCGFDGSLHFFKTDMVIQDVYFRMNSDDCNQFTFSFNTKRGAAKLSADAKKLLLQVKQ
jgi:hypothetical protein